MILINQISSNDEVKNSFDKLSPEEKTALTIKLAQKNLQAILKNK